MQITTSTSVGTTSAAVGQWVVAAYAGRPYVGRVINVDDGDGERHVTFLQESSVEGRYHWPRVPDEIWIPASDVFSIIPEPRPCGHSQRFFDIGDAIDAYL